MAVAAGVVASQVATAEAYSLASASAHEVHVEPAAETARYATLRPSAERETRLKLPVRLTRGPAARAVNCWLACP